MSKKCRIWRRNTRQIRNRKSEKLWRMKIIDEEQKYHNSEVSKITHQWSKKQQQKTTNIASLKKQPNWAHDECCRLGDKGSWMSSAAVKETKARVIVYRNSNGKHSANYCEVWLVARQRSLEKLWPASEGREALPIVNETSACKFVRDYAWSRDIL